jgi:hypothetical protein
VAKLLQTNLPFATGPNVTADTFNQLVRILEINLGSIDPDNTLQLTTAERDTLNFNIGQIIYNTTTTTLQYWDGAAFQNISAIGAVNLNVSDGTSTIGINLNTQTLSLIGGTGITSNASGTSVTFAIDSSVVTLTGSQTLTNKTLTSPTLTSPVLNGTLSGSAFLDEDNMASNSATAVASQQSIKAYVDSQVGTVDTLAEILANGNTTGGTDIAVSANDDITFTDSSKALFGAGNDLQIYHDGTHSYIEETNGTGNLYIRGESIDLRRQANGEQYILAQPNGAVTLFYDGLSKLATTNTGIDVTGITVTDGITSSAAYKSSGGDTGTSGQLLNLAGDAVNQTNSGTIRLTEKTYDVSPFFQGAYIKYNGAANTFLLGTHAAANQTLSDDLDAIELFRGSTTVNFKGAIQSNGTTILTSGRDLQNIDSLTFTGVSGTTISIPSHAGFEIDITGASGGNIRSNGDFYLLSNNAINLGSGGTNSRLNINSAGAATFSGSLTVQSTTTFNDDVTFTGASANILYDSSTNNLEFQDTAKASFGTGNDLLIYHDSESVIEDVGTNGLIIRTDGPNISIDGGSEVMGKFIKDGAVELYYDNNKRFETTSIGVNIPNQLVVQGTSTFNDDAFFVNDALWGDNDKAIFGASSDLQIYHNSFASVISDVGTGDLYIGSDNSLLITDSNLSEVKATFATNGAVTLYYDNSAKLATTSTGITVTGTITSGAITSSGLVTADELSVTNDATFNGSVDASGQEVTAGTYVINNIAVNGSSTATTSATTQVAVDSVSKTTFRTVKYLVQITNSTDSTYHATEILVTHDGTTPSITEYATIFTGAAEEATFSADISGSNLRLLATPASTDSMTFKITRTGIKV